MRIFHSLLAAAALVAAVAFSPGDVVARASAEPIFASTGEFVIHLGSMVDLKADPVSEVLTQSPEVSPAVTAQNGANTSQGASMRVHRKLVASYLVNVDRLAHAPPQGVAAPVPIRV